jgi:hypothetical protein
MLYFAGNKSSRYESGRKEEESRKAVDKAIQTGVHETIGKTGDQAAHDH